MVFLYRPISSELPETDFAMAAVGRTTSPLLRLQPALGQQRVRTVPARGCPGGAASPAHCRRPRPPGPCVRPGPARQHRSPAGSEQQPGTVLQQY